MAELMRFDCDDEFEDFPEYSDATSLVSEIITNKYAEYWLWNDWGYEDDDDEERELRARRDYVSYKWRTQQATHHDDSLKSDDSSQTDLQDGKQNEDSLLEFNTHLLENLNEKNVEILENKHSFDDTTEKNTKPLENGNGDDLNNSVEKQVADSDKQTGGTDESTSEKEQNGDIQLSATKNPSQFDDKGESDLEELIDTSEVLDINSTLSLNNLVEQYLNDSTEKDHDDKKEPQELKVDLQSVTPSPSQRRKNSKSTQNRQVSQTSPVTDTQQSLHSEQGSLASSSARKKTPASTQRTSPVCTRSSGKKLIPAAHQVKPVLQQEVACNLCTKKFKSIKGLKIHLKAMH